MDQNLDVVNLISSLLNSGKYKEALSVPNDEKYQDIFKDNCWDLISNIIQKIQDDTVIIKPSLQGACEELLLTIVHKSVPEEALLEFIEQIDLAKNDAQLSVILTPVQELLKKLTIKRGRSLEWCLNSISTYIEGIPTPDYQLEGKEHLLLDNETNFRRIVRVYSLLPPFYGPFIKELSEEGAIIRTKEIISAFLISLLGKPLIYIDLNPESSSKSEISQCISIIIVDLCTLVKNVYKFLPFVHLCYKESERSNNSKSISYNEQEEKSPYEHREKINITTLSGLFYVTNSGHFEVPENAIPCVYAIDYTVNTILLCVVHMLGFTEYGPLSKAIALCKALFNSIPDKCSSDLLSTTHFEVCKGLVNVAIYSNFEIIRKSAVNLINYQVNKFEYKGRCMLIKYILNIANHSGMIGYAITLYKNSINEAFQDDDLPDCFRGPQLAEMIKKICYLPHGAESDLVELADQIITALNFLRYLTLRDNQNVTGIRECTEMIENEYLEKLRIGLNMSKAHYEVKLNDIKEAKTLAEDKIDVTINVGGNVLDTIPTENKTEIINSALNAFHLMQGLVARLSECISASKKQEVPMIIT